jgi:alpha-L-fucosidase 2
MGSTCDLAQLFLDVTKAAEVLGVDVEFHKTVDAAYKRVHPFKIGSQGQLQEWVQDWPDANPDHHHSSHLLALYPLHLITPRGTPELFEAARRALELRSKALVRDIDPCPCLWGSDPVPSVAHLDPSTGRK